MRSDAPQIEYYGVSRVLYNLHEKTGSPPMIKVSYICGFLQFHEYIMLEHKGIAWRYKEWWKQRHREEPPSSTYEALARVSELRVPSRIRVHVNKKFPEVLSYEF
jgi:DNA repair protein RadD